MKSQTSSKNRIEAGIGQGVITKAPDVIFVRALGSCVAVTLYDGVRKIGGMAHIMLPLSPGANGKEPYHYADTAIRALLANLCAKGAQKRSLKAKAVGGAQMFCSETDGGIGFENIASVKSILQREGIPLMAEDTGGNRGRNAEFHLDSGKMKVTAIGQMAKEI